MFDLSPTDALSDLLAVDPRHLVGEGAGLGLFYMMVISALVVLCVAGGLVCLPDRGPPPFMRWTVAVFLGVAIGCSVGYAVADSEARATDEARVATERLCPVVLDGIASGRLKYIGEDGGRLVPALCGSREFIAAANAPASTLRTADADRGDRAD